MERLDASVCLFEEGRPVRGSEPAWELAKASYPGSQAAFAWRYESAPDGACAAVVADGERVVSRVLGVRKKARLDGEEVFFIEVDDLCNDFEYRSGLARAKTLQACGEAFAKAFGARAPEGHPILYGTPTRRAHRFGLRCFKWEILRSEARLRVRPEGLRLPPAAGVEVEELECFPEGIDGVCAAVASSRGAILERDARRLQHRYFENPEREYAIGAARKGGEYTGLCVLAGERIVDWVCADDAHDSAAALCAWADARAREGGHEALEAVFPETSPEWLLFQRAGFWVEAGRDYTAFRSFQKPYIMSWLFFNWYYTEGDFGRG